jgi:asparagine synthase (glutamine-hydrolysing)
MVLTMCGICGFFGLKGKRNAETLIADLKGMTETLRHRGPDDSGTWVDVDASVALGHRRLSILDLSEAGKQPMSSESGRLVIVYNGEIYNFIELRQELEAMGCKFRGRSDTEVLLAAIDRWGVEKSLERVNGMFAFALWDRWMRTLTLARDRVGKKPLYYGQCGDGFVFSSELKAMKAYPGFNPKIDRDALGLLIQYAWIPSPLSIFKNIRKLPAGTFLSIRPQESESWSAKPEAYWSAVKVAQCGEQKPFTGSFEEAADTLEKLLLDAVQKRMISDVSLGGLLSGGIDSTTIVSLMQSLSRHPVKTFSIGFHEPRYNEAEHAKAVAAFLGTEHTELYVSAKDSLDVIPMLPTLYDEPFADPSQIPTLLVSKLARRAVTVALSGDGGDELFAGYKAYYQAIRHWKRLQYFPMAFRRPLARFLGAAENHFWQKRSCTSALTNPRWHQFVEFFAKQSARLPSESLPLLFARQNMRCASASEFVIGAQPVKPAFLKIATCSGVFDPLQVMMVMHFCDYLPDDILVKVDRASMAVSLEVRCPILDHRVVEFAWSLPMNFRVGHNGGKRVLKKVLSRHVPPRLTERRKKGFSIPLTDWLKGPLRDWAEALLNPKRLSLEGHFLQHAVTKVWRQHLTGWRNHSQLLWSILMFQAWYESWFGQNNHSFCKKGED